MGIFDWLKPKAKSFHPADLRTEIATHGPYGDLLRWLKTYVDPDEILRKLGKGIEAYRSLLYDAHVDSCLRSRFSGTKLQEWRIVTEGTSGADKRARDFIAELFKTLDISRIKRQILNAVLFGYSVNEILWDSDGKNWYPTDVVEKPQEWFKFGADRELLYFPKGARGIPVDSQIKFLLCRNEPSYMNPYGEKMLSRIFWPVQFRKGGWEFWMEFAEKFGQAYILGKYPEEWDPSDPQVQSKLNELKSALSDLVGSATGIAPDNTNITVVDSANKSGSKDLYDQMIHRADSDISKVILGSTLTSQEGNSGNYSLGKVHFQVRGDIILSDMEFQKRYFDELIRRVVSLNFNVQVMPEFRHYEEDDLMADRAERDTQLHAVGVRFKKPYYINRYGLAEDEFEVSEAAETSELPAMEFGEKDRKKANPEKAFLKKEKLYQEILDGLENLAVQAGRKKFEAFQSRLGNLIRAGSDYESLSDRILEEDKIKPDEWDQGLGDVYGVAGVLAALKIIDINGEKAKKIQLFAEGDGVFEFLSEFNRRMLDAGYNESALTESQLRELSAIARGDMETIWNSKAVLDPEEYRRLNTSGRSRAFTIGGDYSRELIGDVYDSLYQSWDDGKDFKEWKSEYLSRLELDPPLPGYQAETVYRQNLLNNYHIEQYRKQTSPEMMELAPYGRYVAIMDSGTSDICRQLHGTVARLDDPFWESYYPPNHFGCRSTVESIDEEDRKQYEENDKDYRTPDAVQVKPYISADGKYDFSNNPAISYYGRPSDMDLSGSVPALIGKDRYKHRIGDLSGEAFDQRELFEGSDLSKPATVKRFLKDITVDSFKDSDRRFGETLVLEAKGGRKVLLSPKYLIEHFTDSQGQVKPGHFETLAYLKEALTRPATVLFSPTESRSTGKVFLQWHYLIEGMIPKGSETGEWVAVPIRVVVRYYQRKYFVVTSYSEKAGRNVYGIIEK